MSTEPYDVTASLQRLAERQTEELQRLREINKDLLEAAKGLTAWFKSGHAIERENIEMDRLHAAIKKADDGICSKLDKVED